MKRTKKLLSFFLAIMMVITTIPAFTLTTNAENWSGNLTTTDSAGYRYYAGHDVFHRDSKRINSSGVSGAVTPTINVCNDGERGNFCAGLWVFDMNSNIPTSIKSLTATLTIKVINANGDSRGVNFYITGDTPSNVNNSSSLTGVGTSIDTVKGYFNSTGLTLVRSVAQNEVNQTKTYTIDVSEHVKNARLNGWNRFNVLAIQETAGDKNSNGTRWSDLHIEKPTIHVNAVEKKLSTTVTAADNANSSTYRVVLDDAIYTYESSSAYYNYGTTISTDDPWDTQVYFKSGSASDIDSITCLDSGAKLTLNNTNQLQGNLSADKFRVSSGATGVNATLLFTFKDGTKEYHRVAVKSYPVENHIMASSEYHPTFGNWKESGYTMFMRGSTGSNGMSSLGVWKYYNNYFKSNKNEHGFPDQDNNSYTTGKKAQTFMWSTSGAATDASLATYYIDKSCRDTSWAGLGNSELWDGTNYNISIEVVRTRFKYPIGSGWNFDLNNMPVQNKLVRTDNNGSDDTNGTTYGLKFTHNASVNESNRWTNASDNTCNVRVAVKASGGGYAVLRTNMVVKLFDKSTARSKYDELIQKKLIENNYTASSFAAYQNALLAMEAYLSNYEDTSEAKAGSKVYTDLVNAYNGLVPRTTEAQYQELKRLDQQYKTAKSHATSKPVDRPYTNTSYNNFINAYLDNSTDQAAAEQALAKYEAGTMDLREFAQSTYTTYKNAYHSLLDFLVERADFSGFNNALTAAESSNYLGKHTTKDTIYGLPTFTSIQEYNKVVFYDQLEKPASEQADVNTAKLNLANANLAIYNNIIDHTALKAFIDQNFDLDVVDNSNIDKQKGYANGLYKSITFNGNEYWSLNVADQSDLNAKLRDYLNSINSTLGQYDIKVPAEVKVAVANNTLTAPTPVDGICTYTLTYGVPVTFTSTNEDTAWYMKYKSNVAQRGQQYQCSGETYATKVMGNMTVTPKARVNDTTPNKVTVVRQYSDGSSSAMLIDYVNGSYVLPTAQTYPNYTFTGYEVAAGSNATIGNGTVTGITGDTVIYANYTAANSNHQIIITDTNGTRTESTYKYNSAVKLNDPNAYAWIEKPIGSDTWRPSYIGTGCSYKVTEPMELMAVKTEAEMKQYCGTKEAYAPNLRYNGPLVANGMGVVFHGQFINYVPKGAQIVEYGVLIYKGNSNDFDLTTNKDNIVRCKSTNPMKSNQFSVGARYNGNTFTSSTTISYRSYMIYQITVNNQLETRYVYSDIRTFNPNPNA